MEIESYTLWHKQTLQEKQKVEMIGFVKAFVAYISAVVKKI